MRNPNFFPFQRTYEQREEKLDEEHVRFLESSSEILCIPSERDALLRFKHHLQDPSNRLSSWNASNPNCCHWEGVVCSNVTAHILQLHLNTSLPPSDDDDLDYYPYLEYPEASEAYLRSRFGGEINHSLVDLKHLSYLDLSGNYFGGKQIPSFLGAITTLTYLNLSRAGFDGNIPHEIGNLSNLLYLDLSGAASGEIPYQIGNLTNLLYLDLENDYYEPLFTENLHWLSGLSYLQYLDLSYLHLQECTLNHHNQPSTVNFSSLITLDLSKINYPDGISLVPKWIFGLRKLVSLQLRGNNIQGPIPDGIQNLTLLQNLDLSFNLFSSSMPDWLYSLQHLKILNLGSNAYLCGSISDDLGNLTSLVGLDLSGNQLEGKIPSSLGYLTSLVGLDFSENKLEGKIPFSFGNLSSLRLLDLSKNQLNGNPFEMFRSFSKLSILLVDDNLFQGVVKEDDLANLTRLKKFYASGNNFTLKVGPNWHPSFHLSELKMNSWQLGPSFPSWIHSQKNLIDLDMSNTGISGSIPTWFWEIVSYAADLNLSHNHIHGELANILKNLPSIEIVDLSSNHLHGKLPHPSVDVSWLDLSSNSFSGSMTDFLCRKQDHPMTLQFLNLAANNLSGEVPDCWILWPNLVEVILQSNHFVGNLPQSMGSLTELESLNIRNNTLSGIFPPILKNTNKLISLDLGENRLTGIIPKWVGKRLLNLKILRLRSNRFLGHIPNQICDMIFLQDLDLAQNNLSGNIPKCFNHLNAMLLSNRIMDSFIHTHTSHGSTISTILWVKGRDIEYRNLLGLVTNVDLSNNNLSGVIPREITNLDGLIYLNLSKNQLIGQIPPSIGNMRSLESIDFSRNRLSGEIPSTISNLSFLSRLDLSYNHLRGEIPTGTQLQSFEASNFVGNNLCGPPLFVNCSSNRQIPDDDHKGKKSDGHEINWFFVSMALGFIGGFWVVVAPLFIYRSWRYAYFNFLDDMWYRMQSFFRL
ncbi:receptor-like protein EIX2 [Gastrolobium bilobum]|uniref:receptor-like protein EIX2 n=1 Tax=Gastrolobium bilobum TaxID=150636 RepID=UPI002AB03853|nr:receptor-like protein EIX2 [Gastrolobium bilobum]